MTSNSPADIVTAFLDDLARGDVRTGLNRIADDIEYVNVSLPAVRGKKRFAKVMGLLDRDSCGFDYQMVNIAADDDVVLTERIDELKLGPVTLQFWVCGRFEVRDGVIAVWRDYFDYVDFTKAIVRGVAATVIPSLRKPLHAVSR